VTSTDDPAPAAAGVAVITGGASGFGLALGDRCAAHGFAVVLLDRDGSRAETEAATLAATRGVETLGMATDVARGADVTAAAAAVQDRFGRADLVISNVGVQLFGAAEHLTEDEWGWVLDVNVTGSARVAAAFLPLLRLAPRGRLAFTTSASVLDPASRMAAYQASKFAVWGLAETLRLELADDGIGVSVIFPSGMITRHLETSTEAQPEAISRPIGADDDFTAMLTSNPALAEAVVTPEDAARRVIEAVLADEPYVITHGDLTVAAATRATQLRRAAQAALLP
jgi:NAD(P)-dependent dehydrogenase (short-subunit alcohol dehydrogenase family)